MVSALAYSIYTAREFNWLRRPEIKLILPIRFSDNLRSSAIAEAFSTLCKFGVIESNHEGPSKIAHRWTGNYAYPFEEQFPVDEALVHKEWKQRITEFRKGGLTKLKYQASRLPYATKEDLAREEARLRQLLKGADPLPMPKEGYGTGTVADVLKFNFAPVSGTLRAETNIGIFGYALWLLRGHGPITTADLEAIVGIKPQGQIMSKLMELRYIERIGEGKGKYYDYRWIGDVTHPLRYPANAGSIKFKEDPVSYFDRVYGVIASTQLTVNGEYHG